MTSAFAVVVAYQSGHRGKLFRFIERVMEPLKSQEKGAILVAVEQVDPEPVEVGTLFNLAVRSVHCERYLFCAFTDLTCTAGFSASTEDVVYQTWAGLTGAVCASRSALSAINGFPNSASEVLEQFDARVRDCQLVTREQPQNGEIVEGFWGHRPDGGCTPVVVKDDASSEDGLWTVETKRVVRRDEASVVMLQTSLVKKVERCSRDTCDFVCTMLDRTHCCVGCRTTGVHSALCARKRRMTVQCGPSMKKRVYLGLFGLHRNFDKTAPLLFRSLVQCNPDFEFFVNMHTNITSRSRRDKGFGGGPVRTPRRSQDDMRARLRDAYAQFGKIESIVFDDETHFKWHPGHENIRRDKDEPVTYRIWSMMQTAQSSYDVYCFIRFDVEPVGDISLADYDESTFRIISSAGTMNCFFHNHNWDFCWVGGHRAMQSWVYPAREFSTWIEKGLHRDVSSGIKGLEAWVKVRNEVVPGEECRRILKAIGSNGNDKRCGWFERHDATGVETQWSPMGETEGPDGMFVSAAGASWTAEFRDGLFYPSRPECLGEAGVKKTGPLECRASTWCRHGSTFRYESSVHWRSEQYCRIIRNMQNAACTFGFRDAEGEFLRLRRD